MWEWSFYSIVLPLMAVPLTYFGSWVANRRTQFFRLIRDGQLCFYSTTILAVNLNDLLKIKGSSAVGIFAAYHIFILVFTTFAYGASVTLSNQAVVSRRVAIASLIATFLSVLLIILTRIRLGIL
jgi:hypothetical protein